MYDVVARCEEQAGTEASAAALSRLGGQREGRERMVVPYLPPFGWTPPQTSAFDAASSRAMSPSSERLRPAASRPRRDMALVAAQGAHMLRDGADTVARMAALQHNPQQLRDGFGRFAQKVGEHVAEDAQQNIGLAPSPAAGAPLRNTLPPFKPVVMYMSSIRWHSSRGTEV